MRFIKCDRCGRKEPMKGSRLHYSANISPRRIEDSERDLCVTCWKALEDFLKPIPECVEDHKA